MKKSIIAAWALSMCVFHVHAQNQNATRDTLRAVESNGPVIVEATRAVQNTPVAFTNLDSKAIAPLNTGQDVPYILRFTPSLVSTSDGGTGIGYTGLWIRGSDPSRINVTINGVPLNDPESQQVFWVNLPDFSSGVNSIQIQRGVGTSTNGAGAFGGTIKMETTSSPKEAYAQWTSGVGSFNTLRNTVKFGTGVLKDHFMLEGRISQIKSDGYIDRARADLKSAYLAGTWLGKRTIVRFTGFTGREETYQSWYGTPESRITGNSDSLSAYVANNYLSDNDAANLLNSGRTYNYYTYANQIDHYGQDHAQFHLSHLFNSRWSVNGALHYTKGGGYFEEYKESQSFSRYGLSNIHLASDTVVSDGMNADGQLINSHYAGTFASPADVQFQVATNSAGDTLFSGNQALLVSDVAIRSTNLVRRRWLDNHFYGGVFSARYNGDKWDAVIGGGYNQYLGKHFGEFIWLQYAGPANIGDHYYDGKSRKNDGNIYGRLNVRPTDRLNVYLDLQYRDVVYSTSGTDNDLRAYLVNDHLRFFNPKAGLTFNVNKSWSAYASYAIANKEPNRNDYVDAPEGTKPKSERLADLEAGVRHKWFRINYYLMQYKDQLVLTGALNDVGAPLRINVPKSYRTGVELEANYRFKERLEVGANLTLSQSRIASFKESVPDYLNGGEVLIEHTNSPIAYSPAVISGVMLNYTLIDSKTPSSGTSLKPTVNVAWMTKYVSKQYLDNTGTELRTIGAYTVSDVRIMCSWKWSKMELGLNLTVNNALNALYSSNGYTWSYYYGSLYNERFFYPQATRNYLFNVTLGW